MSSLASNDRLFLILPIDLFRARKGDVISVSKVPHNFRSHSLFSVHFAGQGLEFRSDSPPFGGKFFDSSTLSSHFTLTSPIDDILWIGQFVAHCSN